MHWLLCDCTFEAYLGYRVRNRFLVTGHLSRSVNFRRSRKAETKKRSNGSNIKQISQILWLQYKIRHINIIKGKAKKPFSIPLNVLGKCETKIKQQKYLSWLRHIIWYLVLDIFYRLVGTKWAICPVLDWSPSLFQDLFTCTHFRLGQLYFVQFCHDDVLNPWPGCVSQMLVKCASCLLLGTLGIWS